MNCSDNLNLIFKAIPETLESGLKKGKVAYEVEVSDEVIVNWWTQSIL